MPSPAPTPEAQLQLLGNVERLLSRGRFTSTYKFALLIAITNIAVEQGDDSSDPLDIEVDAALGPGQTVSVRDYELRLLDMKEIAGPNYRAAQARVQVSKDESHRVLPGRQVIDDILQDGVSIGSRHVALRRSLPQIDIVAQNDHVVSMVESKQVSPAPSDGITTP